MRDAIAEFNEHARQLLGKDENWSVYRYERIDIAGGKSAFKLTGGKHRLLKSGNRKGEKTWRPYEDTAEVIIMEEDHRAFRMARHFRETKDFDPDFKATCGEAAGRGVCKNPAAESHGCPFQQEINDSKDDEYCRCCSDCRHECAMNI